MTIQVVETYPNQHGLRRFGRFLVSLVGMVLLIVGLIAAAFDLLLAGTLVAGSDGSDQAESIRWTAILAAVMVAGIWLGIRALRGRRRLGLFLRRFGYRDATQTMSAVVAGRSGRSWRMVTLDDANVAPVGTARRTRRAALLISVVGLAGAGYGVYAVFGTDLLTPQSAVGAVSSMDDFWRNLFTSIAAAIAAVVVAMFILIFAAIALVVGISGGFASRAARAAQERARVVIARGNEVGLAAATIRRNNRRVFGSRMVVCRVATPLWQDVVRELAAASDAVVIDVSHATDNVVWEVETMRAATDHRWVLVCHRDRIAGLVAAADGPGAAAGGLSASAETRLAQLLHGQQVLVYGNSPHEQRSFARSLRNRLDTSALSRPRATTR